MWTELSQDKMLDFLNSIFNEEVSNQLMYELLNSENSNKCIYRPTRGKYTKCENDVNTDYGYCSKHSSTLQAKKAKDKYEDLTKFEEKSEEEEELEEPVKITAVRNKWGNYEHKETGIVFDPSTRYAYGIQKKNGDVHSLKPDDVRLCIEYGWKYKLPNIKYERVVNSDEDESEEETSEEEDTYGSYSDEE